MGRGAHEVAQHQRAHQDQEYRRLRPGVSVRQFPLSFIDEVLELPPEFVHDYKRSLRVVFFIHPHAQVLKRFNRSNPTPSSTLSSSISTFDCFSFVWSGKGSTCYLFGPVTAVGGRIYAQLISPEPPEDMTSTPLSRLYTLKDADLSNREICRLITSF